MGEMLTIIAVTAVAFIGTNLDNLILLVTLHNRYEKRVAMVTAGYFAAMLLIGSISFVLGEVGELIPIAYLGLLGVIPIIIGIVAIAQLLEKKPEAELASIAIANQGHTIFVSVLMTQLSNGTDTIITFSALLADSSDASDYLIAPTFLAMVCVFAWVAFYSLEHRAFSNLLKRYGKYLAPFILILVGVYILANTVTDLMPA